MTKRIEIRLARPEEYAAVGERAAAAHLADGLVRQEYRRNPRQIGSRCPA